MSNIDLPRALEDYFAFAELASTRQGRRFTITAAYFDNERLDRLQWWWQVSSAQERIGGEAGIEALRKEAIERFRLHIERWLVTSGKRLFGGDPFPRLGEMIVDAQPVAIEADVASNVLQWPVDKVANG